MFKKFFTLFISAFLLVSVVACSNTSSQSKKKEYVSKDEISNVFEDPDSYSGKYIKLSGKIFNVKKKDGGLNGYQICYDIKNNNQDFFVSLKSTPKFNNDDYVTVDGMINGTLEAENNLGNKITMPEISSAKVKKSSYMDLVVPAKKTISPNASQEINGIKLTIDKIEYAEEETRVYVTVVNNSGDTFDLNNYDIKLTMNGTQIEQDNSSLSQYEGDYPQLSYEILNGITNSGILVFPKMDQNNFTLLADGYTDANFDEINFEIQVNVEQ
ncbi:hypothetical protein [Absicoccus intestinalis]|uniref:DUF4352 domain-containing protein n=1 Tax=Absicoccus intestinalis TaxID=2926319 RepID=A0ABU4WNI5_9FIRM|nr:hypothetical protein [Absicoccus sp. CLA-KB-P134]MDX8418127.1 hypothetical protein [Absicoccus sp. CLA-KB-P134]